MPGQNDRKGSQIFDPPSGMIRPASIKASSRDTFSVQMAESPAIKGIPRPVPIPAVYPLIDSSGLFIGSLPAKNTTITVQQELGGKYHFVSYEPENTSLVPNLKPGQLLIQSTDSSKISLDLDSHIRIGSDISNIHILAGSSQYPSSNLITINFDSENHFNQALRQVAGIVKRDLYPNPLAASYSGSTKLEDDNYWYSNKVRTIGLDPSATANNIASGPTKNPPLVEHRETIYEFQYRSSVDDDGSEANKYTTTSQGQSTFSSQNRRKSRADTMSLSLDSPNYLMEQVKGTVVDVYGNILDINRLPLPIGLSADTTLRASGTVATTNAKQSYMNIRALERKSIAYHFEVNARKDPNPLNQGSALSINDDNANAKGQRSRFYFDVDKEGQFKFNVPASSESGNIPLLIRPENYSSFATTDGGNKNQTWFVESGQPISQDIFVDSFAAPQTKPSTASSGYDTVFAHGSIQLVDGSTNKDAGPPDRISQFVKKSVYNIRHGTAYHDVLQTCSLQQNNQSIQQYPLGEPADPSFLNYINGLQNMTDVVSKTIKVSGKGANAGGRSGSINLDGSLEMNIGANSVDRQSLWLDTAGGMVANIGRDRNQRSAIMNLDGDLIMQIGGFGVSGDARFTDSGKNGKYNAVLDLRVFSSGYAHMLRIDSTGITVMSPQMVKIHASQGMTLTSDGPINIDCTLLTIYDRPVLKVGPSI